MRSFCLIVNPAAGGGAATAAVEPVARLLRAGGATVEVVRSASVDAVDALVATAVGRGDVVVSVGGDGMVGSLVGPVSSSGGVLGLLPAGRGNDFARMLGVPESAAGQASLLLSGSERTVDLLSYDGRTVAGSVYAGVDAEVAEIVARMRRTPKAVQYQLAAVRAIARYRPASYRLEIDGVVHDVEAATVVVANSGYYGQGMHVAPAASVDDGLLDVVVIAAETKLYLLRSFPKIYDGSHVELDAVTVFRGRRVTLSADGRVPVPVGGDGEPLGVLPPLGGAPVAVEVRPGALRVIA